MRGGSTRVARRSSNSSSVAAWKMTPPAAAASNTPSMTMQWKCQWGLADGGTGGSASVRIGFLAGDVNQNRVVTISDLLAVNAVLSQFVSALNYLRDVNAS